MVLWTAQQFNEYMQEVRACNKHYERFKKSRIHTFTGLLKMKRFQNSPQHLLAIKTEWDKVPPEAKTTYASAWQYVQDTLFPNGLPQTAAPLPGLGAQALPGMTGGLGAQAARVAQKRQVRVDQQAIHVDEFVEQVLDRTRYKWKVKFSIHHVAAGKQGQTLVVKIPIAGYGGDTRAHQEAVRSGLTGGIPSEHVGAPLTDEVKLNWASRIMERWGGGEFVVKDSLGDDLETYDIDFQLEWVDNPSLAAQIVFAVKSTGNAPPDGTVNTMYWGVDDGATKGAAIAHEFGHLIGNPDEYGNCTFKGKNNTRDATSVMDNETTGQAKVRHLFMVGTKAAQGLGHPPNRCTVRLNAQEHLVALDHPW